MTKLGIYALSAALSVGLFHYVGVAALLGIFVACLASLVFSTGYDAWYEENSELDDHGLVAGGH
jgi:hypothetical protein